MKHNLFWLHAITPLHNGAGQGLGAIDRPVIREAATGYPFVQISTLKGAVRARVIEQLMAKQKDGSTVTMHSRTRDEIEKLDAVNDDDDFLAAFGVGETDGNQGCLIFTDAQLLLLPVRSLAGTFAWVTSPLSLARLLRWLKIAGDIRAEFESESKKSVLEGKVVLSGLLSQTMPVKPRSAVGCQGKDSPIRLNGNGPYCIEGLILECGSGLEATAEKLSTVAAWLGALVFSGDAYWADKLSAHMLLLRDDDFSHLIRQAMQVEANIRSNCLATFPVDHAVASQGERGARRRLDRSVRESRAFCRQVAKRDARTSRA